MCYDIGRGEEAISPVITLWRVIAEEIPHERCAQTNCSWTRTWRLVAQVFNERLEPFQLQQCQFQEALMVGTH